MIDLLRQLLTKLRLFIIAAIMAVVVVILGLFIMQFFSPQTETYSAPTIVLSPASNSAKNNLSKPTYNQKTANKKSFWGHFSYQEANQKNLILVASYGRGEYQRFEQLHQEAAKELIKLIYTARTEGVWIVVVSGFRTIQQQQKLWNKKIQSLNSEQKAAQFSAPPGYSEHHTGYAVDLADGQFPDLDLTPEFENTAAFQWLKIHAKEYGFEMSFPPNNSQGISYEPWHWRFIGSPEAIAIFANAKNPEF